MIEKAYRFFPEKQRQYLLNNDTLPDTLKQYLSHPLISKQTPIKNIEFLVLDFETTGLNAKQDRIVSMGYTLIKDLHLSLKESAHFLVKPKRLLTEQNVSIHQLTDDEVAQGLTLFQMMSNLFQMMKNRVVIVHFDNIEKKFINEACKQLYQFDNLPIRMLDTLKIEIKKRSINQAQTRASADNLRLFALRNQYNLPRYKAHNAMQDAISTAELFLAQMAYIGNINTIKLGDLLF